MDTTTLNPGNRPRRGLVAAIGALAVLTAVVGVTLAGTPERAEAAELSAFASCAELERWGADAAGRGPGGRESFEEVSGTFDTAEAGAVDAAPAAERAGNDSTGAGADGDTGATNVAVDGVDELDLVDRLPGERVLVSSRDRLSLVDLGSATVLDAVEIVGEARISHDPESQVVWVVGPGRSDGDDWRGGSGTSVARIAVGDGSLTPDGAWETSGWLVDARRVGDRLHLVATEDFGYHERPVPFADGPVACDEVLHPPVPSQPSATLVVTLPATGAVEPIHATQVVGSGQLVHVTLDAAYLATPLLHEGEPTTSIHRFDLAELAHTGSGRVDGRLLDDFAMSEHDGHLRVAVTTGDEVFFGPMMEDGLDVEVAPAPRAPEPSTPTTSTPDTTETTDPDPEEPEPVEPPVEEPLPEPLPVEPLPVDPPPGAPLPVEPGPGGPVPPPLPGSEGARNEIVVLDIEGDLDVVGRTPRFGKPGESIHGIRFTGEVAYAVTFLTTDPFYVVDLAEPTNPTIEGEVELPGFSAYLHPLSDSLVAGFGPDEAGRASVKLFDVSDRTAPRVVDDLLLGDDSPVVWDHHAFVALDEGTFAVPAATWRSVTPAGCTERDRSGARAEADRLEAELEELFESDTFGSDPADDRRLEDLYQELDEVAAGGCLYSTSVTESEVVVVDASGGTLREVERHAVASGEPASRVLPTATGWAVLAGPELVLLDPAGAVRATVELR